jgi:serine phosphatase RsbU (regulator of sigma subunit)
MKKLIIVCIITLFGFECISQNLDSLWLVWKDTKQSDENRLQAIQNYSWNGYLHTQPDSAFYFAQLQYDFALSKRNMKHMAGALNTQGTSYSLRGDFPKALDYFFRCLTIKQNLGDKQGIGGVYNSIGNVYRNQSNYSKALEYYFKSLKIAEDLNDKQDLSNTLGNIGAVYTDQSDFKMALKYYHKDLKISKELGDKFSISITLSNIGAVYDYQANYPKALKYYFWSLKLAEELNDKQGIGITLGNIGNVYAAQGDNIKALDYYYRSLKIYEEIGDKQGLGISLGSIGGLYTKQGKYSEAEKYLKKALQICKEIGAQNFEKDYHSFLATLYEKTNRPALALIHFKSFVNLKDSIFSEENAKELLRTEIDHEFEKQRAVSNAKHQKEMEKQKALAKEKSRRQKIILYIVVTGLLVVLVFLVIIFRSNKQKQLANKIITQQKNEVEQQKYLVEEKNKEITDSINYAKRIQSAILPQNKFIKEYLPNSFILYKPKDIVAGDFYWFDVFEDVVFIAAADCTGHGVPGALVSVVCNNALNRSVKEFSLKNPAEILNKTREIVVAEFEKSDEDVKDGMDISLCAINLETNILHWSGAHNPLWIMRSTSRSTVPENDFEVVEEALEATLEIIETKADKQPIGKFAFAKDFTHHEFQLKKGDEIYIFTDGFQDQFGGPESKFGGKKYKVSRLRELLIALNFITMEEKRTKIEEAFENWKGELEQVDDVCVIGLKI